MGRAALVIDKEEFQKTVTALENAKTFAKLSDLWKAVEETAWAKSIKPRGLSAASAYQKANEFGIIVKTKPAKRGRQPGATSKPVKVEAPKDVRKLPSSSSVQMAVMDVEFDGALDSFQDLCEVLSEKFKCTEGEIENILMGLVTKTPKPESKVDEEEPVSIPETPKKEFKFAEPPPKVFYYDASKNTTPVMDRPELTDRYKTNWMKWYALGKADKAANKPLDYTQIPNTLPLEEGYPNIKLDIPVRMWSLAYFQGYEGRQDHLCLKCMIPTAKAKGMSWSEWQIKKDTNPELVEEF